MTSKIETSNLTDDELRERINDCRIRILEELGIEVSDVLRAGSKNGRN